MNFKQALLRFLTDLDAIAEKHPEITDIMVKEQISESVIYYVVHRQENGLRPIQYGMVSKEANEAVARSVNRFAETAWNDAHYKLLAASERLELLQDFSVQTDNGSTVTDYLILNDTDADAINSIPEQRFKDLDATGFAELTGKPSKPRYNIRVLYASLVITLLIIAGIIYMVLTFSNKS
ncbi:MAG: hypothetical protein ACAI35_04155 [Candidatus Methylacidiphilales bacterium]|nr:hypothetical protein [Candidatus Methylacidiphilales bacterium]